MDLLVSSYSTQRKVTRLTIIGPLKILGPSSMNYDVDIGPFLLSDWYHNDAFDLYPCEIAPSTCPIPTGLIPQSFLLQGHGHYCTGTVCTGNYYHVDFIKGTTYKLSIVNGGTGSMFTFWIEGHTFTVIGMDFVPIEPYKPVDNVINIAIGKLFTFFMLT